MWIHLWELMITELKHVRQQVFFKNLVHLQLLLYCFWWWKSNIYIITDIESIVLWLNAGVSSKVWRYPADSPTNKLPNRGRHSEGVNLQTGSQKNRSKDTHTHTQNQGPHVRSIYSWVKWLLSCPEAAGGKVKLIEFVRKIFSAHLRC